MKSKLFLSIILIYYSVLSYSQVTKANSFLVVTFEKSLSKYPQDKVKTYYWIMPTDSIYDKHFSIYPLLADGFSMNDFDSCCAGNRINPFVYTTETRFDFDSSYVKELKRFNSLIKTGRKKIEEITKQWNGGYTEKIIVYTTPITGIFCYSGIRSNSKNENDYTGSIYIPKSSFMRFDDFWKSDKFKLIQFIDYSKINFNISPL